MRRVRFILGALPAALWIAPLSAQAPTGTIRGQVVDQASRQPLARVTVTFGARATLTEADGRYFITGVPAASDSLRARMIGYAPTAQAITVRAGQTLDVDLSLAAQAVALSELVVVGYGEQSAGNITGAVTQVTSEEFNTGRIVSPGGLIQAKVAGVEVVDNNEPGGGLAIRIRGATSVSASSDPLYVVDGVPVGGTSAGGGISAGPANARDALNFLNPNDIASITVLKDAAAAAIYGANAANGVVLIQTRRGRRGGPQFEYSGSTSASSVTRLPSMLNAAQYRAAVQQYAPQNASQLGNANTDWFSLVDRTAFGQEHNFGVSGAGETMNWRLSLGYLNQDGIMRGTTVQRLSLGMNFQQRLFSNRLDLRANLRGSREFDDFTPGSVIYNAAQMGPTQPVYDSTTPTGYYNWPGNTLTSADNPVQALNLMRSQGTTLRSVGNVQADYTLPFFPALRANINLGYDVTRVTTSYFEPSSVHGQIKSGQGGYDYRSDPSMLNSVLEAYLNYSAPLNVMPGNVDLTAGYSYAQSHAEYPSFQASNVGSNPCLPDCYPVTSNVSNFLDIQESRLISFFGRVNYNLHDRYLANFSIRRDGSSRFGPSNAWGVFPSVALAWRLSEEPFLRGLGSLSDLKLRLSWARTGNQAFANYQQYTAFLSSNSQASAQFGNTFVGTIRPSAVDPNIKWEETSSYNIGLDYGFHSQRFSGSIDFYNKKTSDLIFYVPIAAGTNLSNFLTTNIGSMRNRGFEFSLSARLMEGGRRGLGWTANFTAGHNSNELTSITPFGGASQRILTGGIAGGVGSTIQVLTPGVPINSFFACRQYYQNGRPVEGKYLSLVGDTVVSGCTTERRAFHDPAPKWILGHTSYLTWGNWDASFTLRAWIGNYVYNNVSSNLGTYQELSRASPYNLHSSVLTTGFMTPQYLSDYYIENGSFLRMDNITVGYTFRYREHPMRLFATVQSAFTITGYSGVDPTAGLNGIDNNIYPRARTVTTGLSVRF